MDKSEFNTSSVHHSGNSDVDIHIQIETASIAYMYACSLLATGQINENQFHEMIEKYHHLIKNNHRERTAEKPVMKNYRTNVKLLGPPRKLT